MRELKSLEGLLDHFRFRSYMSVCLNSDECAKNYSVYKYLQELAELRSVMTNGAKLAEILCDVLSDCELPSGIRTEIERRLKAWRNEA